MADTRKQPKIYTYMCSLYERMSSEGNEITEEGRPDALLVWQGKLIDTCTSVGIPTGYYKKVVDTLRKLGCIEQVTTGRRGNTPTTIALRYPPTLELYEDAIVKSGWEGLTRSPSSDTLAADIKDLREQIGGLHIPSIVKELTDRLSGVEAAIKALQQQPQQSSTNQQTERNQ